MTNRAYYSNKTTTRSRSTSTSTSRSSSNNTTTTTTTTTNDMDPGVSYFEEVFERLAPIYEACVLSPMTAPIMAKIKDYMEYYEIGFDVVVAALYETGLAPRPSARYLLAILNRCAGDEICTMEDWKHDKYAHIGKKPYEINNDIPFGPHW